jgi:uncharacterized membrane protein
MDGFRGLCYRDRLFKQPRETISQIEVESRKRSLAKGVTWRVVATRTKVSIAYMITGEVDAALQIGFIEVFAKIAICYLHERAWARVPI